MKRHTRPYGCTFPKCRRNFGSKNDWKRHEGSQHFQNEAWRCERRASAANDDGAAPYAQLFQVEVWRCEHRASAANDAPCGQLFYQKAIFEKHLREQHEMEAQERIDAELSARRIGRNGQSRFWCGFCRTIVELQKRGWDAWEERFDHIDAHFKKKQHIRDWIDVEANKTNAEVAAFMDGHNLEDSDPPPTGGDGGASSNTDQPNEVGPLHAAAEQADAYLFGMTGPKKNATGGSAKSSRKRERNEDGAEPLGQPPQKSRKAETLFFCVSCCLHSFLNLPLALLPSSSSSASSSSLSSFFPSLLSIPQSLLSTGHKLTTQRFLVRLQTRPLRLVPLPELHLLRTRVLRALRSKEA